MLTLLFLLGILLTYLLIFVFMVKVLHSTSRGQITLPKEWRDNFDTDYFKVEIQKEKLIIVPMNPGKSFKNKVEESWKQYEDGMFISNEDLKKKYGL